MLVPAPRGGEGVGNVFALPLRAPGSARERTLEPGGLARAVGTLPGATVTAADARPDSHGRWPTSLSGVEVIVAGQPAAVLAVRPTGGDGYAVDSMTPSQTTLTTVGGRVEVVVRHAPSSARWRLGGWNCWSRRRFCGAGRQTARAPPPRLLSNRRAWSPPTRTTARPPALRRGSCSSSQAWARGALPTTPDSPHNSRTAAASAFP